MAPDQNRAPVVGCGGFGGGACATQLPGVQGPWGKPVAMGAPFSSSPPDAALARAMMSQSVPLGLVQAGYSQGPGSSSGVIQAGGSCPPGGCPPGGCPPGGCAPGMMPPGGGLAPPGLPASPMMPGPGIMPPAGAVAAVGAIPFGTPSRFPTSRTSVRFVGPAGMKVSWYAPGAESKGGFMATQLTVPGRYNFVQAAIYRIKLSSIPNRPGLELYPTLEVVPANARTDTFLAHSAVPVSFTDEDFEQVAAGNYVVKVIYLPDPQFQDLATTGPDEVVSSRLEPGVDPIAEAKRRGCILAVVRVGNIDLEAPNTPPMNAPSPYMLRGMPPMPGGPMGPGGGGGPGPMVPYGFMQQGRPLMMGPNAVLSPPGDPSGAGLPTTLPGPAPDGSAPPATSGSTSAPGADGPVSKLPDNSPIQQARYQVPTTAGLAAQPGYLPAPTDGPAKTHWWSKSSSDQ